MAGASAIDSGVDVMTDELGAQCLICWETCESGSRDCSGCKRSICLECLRRYVVSRVSMGQVDESFLSCPSFGCRMPFPRRVLDEMLGSDTSSKLMRMREILSVNRDRRRCWCPNATCGAAVQLLPPRPPPASTKRNCSSWLSGGRVWWQRRLLFSSLPLSEKKVRCGECMETFCYRCGGQPHRGSCVREPAYQEWAERVGEDSDGVQECPRCHHHIEKRGGCRHMSCTMCGAEWCWICRRSWRNHQPALCRAIRIYKDIDWGKTPAKRAATISIGVPLGICAGAVAIAVGSTVAVGLVAGVATYKVVAVPGKRIKDGVTRQLRERKEAVERKRDDADLDVDEDAGIGL